MPGSNFIQFLIVCLTLSVVGVARAIPEADGEYLILFGRGHGESHAEEPWTIDDDEPLPMPANPSGADQWTGPLAELAYRLYLTGRYGVETLPPGGKLSWLESDNPQDLSRFDLLVICEPTESLDAGELSSIRSFLESGCSLLIVAGAESERVTRESRADLLNLVLEQVLDEPAAGSVAFDAAPQPVTTPKSTHISLDDPITRGPFGTISRVSLKQRLRLTSGDREGALLTGPVLDDGSALYLVAPAGRGKVAILPDSHLMVSGGSDRGGVQNIELTLNLIAYLTDDASIRPAETALSFVKAPEIVLVTDHGATIVFETDRPAWSTVELTSTDVPPAHFRDIGRDHAVRIDGLDPDRSYRATLACYDNWGNGPLRSRELEFRTIPRAEIEYGDIVISEVFWGGENQYLELYNSLDFSVDLRGWALLNRISRYELNGLVPAGGYYLISRAERRTESGMEEVCGDDSDFTMDPAGDFIMLQDGDGNVISSANLTGEYWPAGDGGPSGASMERVDLKGSDDPSNWETALVQNTVFQGTPGLPNSRKSVRIFDPLLNGGVVEESIRLTWETPSGDSAVGVNIYRSEMYDNSPDPLSVEYVRITDMPIPPDMAEYIDTDIRPDISYQYILGAVLPGGEELFSEPIRIRAASASLPTSLEVDMTQNYPNPFNPQTEIRYSIDDREFGEISFPLKVVIAVFNVRGQQIRILEEREVFPGDYTTRWDGRNDIGEPVSSGSYYYRLMIIKPGTGEIILQLSKKMVLLR